MFLFNYFVFEYKEFLFYYILWSITCVVLSLLGLKAYFTTRRFRQHKTIAFFHPFCNDGGGGERVLWKMIQTIRREKPEYYCIVYTGDVDAKPEQILTKVNERFGINLLDHQNYIQFCYLHSRKFVEASMYPTLTILGQSFGAMILAVEGLTQINPDILIDSMGYSFTLPVFRYLGGCKVASYVHYPTISTDMLDKVRYTGSPLKSLKIQYYNFFAILYGLMGRNSQYVWVNSTWTRNHINSLWRIPQRTQILYPPCNISQFSEFPLKSSNFNNDIQPNGDNRNANDIVRDRNLIISIAQFRPEKNHALQLQSLKYLLDNYNQDGSYDNIKLVLIGSCRNAEDESRIRSLKELAVKLKIEKFVSFEVNANFEKLCEWMKRAQFGLHSMWCEHFGIGIVELMASGVIVVAHNSGGPKTDIVVPVNNQITGMLATKAEEYGDALHTLLRSTDEELEQIQLTARKHVKKFADEEFEKSFFESLSSFL